MAFCKNCGSQLKPQDKFCEVCGALAEEKQEGSVGAAPGYNPPPYQPAVKAEPQTSSAGSKKFGLPVIILACVLVVVLIGGIIGIVSLSGTVSDLKEENTQLVADKNQLTSQLSAANNTISGLNNELSEANSEISELTGDLNEAAGTINDLNSDLTEASNSLAEANSNLNAANATIADLEDENEELAADKSELAADLDDANYTILSLNSIIDIMDYNYSEIIAFIDMRFGWAEEDAMQFVTPYDETVGDLVDWLVYPFDSGDWARAWDDMKDMYSWVRSNIEYSYDSPLPVLPLDLLEGGYIDWFREFWQYPVETIYWGTGDCEDQSLLLTSMIKNYGEGSTYAYCIGISNGESGHLAVLLPVSGGNMVIFDPAGGYFTNSWGEINTSKPIAEELNNWLNWWSADIPGAQVTMLFDDEYYWEFDNNNEFVDFLTG